jgi:stage II sporulation SpoD-like protein
MSQKSHFMTRLVFSWFIGTLAFAPTAYSLIPNPPQGTVRILYRYSSTNAAVYWVTPEIYVKDTLPNEWDLGWNTEALKAGAVIIRSGLYWRVHRSDLGSGGLNKNCYEGFYCTTIVGATVCLFYYNDAPLSRGGHENFLPDSHWHKKGADKTNAAVDATFQYHAERANITGRPDALVPLRYGAQLQNRTQSGPGSWLDRIWYAYTGPDHPGPDENPNKDCSQTDTWNPRSDPVFINY